MAKTKDRFAQMGYLQVTESGSNTLTFAGISVFSNILTPKALLIHRIEYNIPDGELAKVIAEADSIKFGMHGDDSKTSVQLEDAQTYDYNRYGIQEHGTPANATVTRMPWIVKYDDLPGGGKLVPADRIFIWAEGVSLASAVTVSCRFHFTLHELSAQEYIELAQALRVLT